MNKILLITSLLMLASCSKISINTYDQTSPNLNLQTFFNGDLKAYGILQDRKGKVTRKFTADIRAYWAGSEGTLDETFYFDDGKTEKRIWKLKDLGNGRISGTADDVVGIAKGDIKGFAMNWVYTLRIPYKQSTIDVKLDDWLYLVTEDRLLNKTDLRKFGFKVGELTLVIEKR